MIDITLNDNENNDEEIINPSNIMNYIANKM